MEKLFFTLEGGDGSGKATQAKILEKSLRDKGCNVLHQEFPRYGKPSAYVTEQYLGKAYGKLSPYAATILYTVDRFDAWKTIIEPHLNPKQISLFPQVVVSDRWVTSNKGHQVGKGKTLKEQEKILDFINDIEHDKMGLPYATQTIYLDVHPLIGQQLSGIGKNLKIKGKDIHEEDIHHLMNARKAYHFVAKKENWVIINAMQQPINTYTTKELREPHINKLLKSREEIHQEVYNSIKKYF